MNDLATSLQTYFTTFAHTQRDLSANTIGNWDDLSLVAASAGN